MPAPSPSSGTPSPLQSVLERTAADRMMAEYLAPMRGKLVAGAAVGIAGGIMALAIPQALRYLVDRVLTADAGNAAVWASAGVIALLGLAQVFFQWFRRFLLLEPAMHLELRMRQELFDHLARLPVSFHDHWPSGQLLSRSMSDLSLTRRWVSFGIAQTALSAATVVVGLGLMFADAWQLSLMYLVAVVPVVLVILRALPRARNLTRAVQQQAGDLATAVEESVHGIRVLKALGRGPWSLERFSTQAAGLQRTEVSRASAFAALSARTWLIPELAMAVALGLAGFLAAGGHLSRGAVIAWFATAVLVTTRVRDVGSILNMYLGARVARERHYQVVSLQGMEDVPVTGVTHPPAPRAEGDPGARLEFQDLGFAYPAEEFSEGAARPSNPAAAPPVDRPSNRAAAPPPARVLEGLDLEVRPGETLALVGTTGSGKSTLLGLVPRLYRPDAGRLLLDGQDTAEMTLDELRGQIAVAFEEPVLFSASVRENVLLGLPEAVDADGEPLDWDALPAAERRERERILAEALATTSAGFVADLPDGVETQIGEEGLSLSGGQRQRLSLARAVAARPRVLLLDDPLSALDTRTEAEVVENLRRSLTGTTTLLTAHRPSTVALADRVALLEDGRVVAVGTHRELMDRADYRHVMSADPAAARPAAHPDGLAVPHVSADPEIPGTPEAPEGGRHA